MGDTDHATAAALIAVDWGTSRLRARLIGADGATLDAAQSDEGIGRISGGHEAVFARLTADWPPVPAIMAGMVGSRQGWREAAYIACPTTTTALAGRMVRFASGGRQVAIVPGLMVPSGERDGDVMRGEETQIVGFLEQRPAFAGVAILPGTHSKWVVLDTGAIERFQSFLTGELYELLARHSFLRHSLAAGEADVERSADFARAVERTAKDGLPFLSAIFSVRARQLLDGVAPEDNLAYLSGLIIGGEIAAARADGTMGSGDIGIIGTQSLARAYARAFAVLGVRAETIDGGEMAFAGLARLARDAGLLADARS